MNLRPLLILLFALPLHAVELVKWERIPLPVALNIGQERIVFVDRNVRVGYPAALEGKLRIQSSNGTLYLLASQPFVATRLQLQDTENGELILLDVSASKSELIREQMRIVREEKKTPDAKPDTTPGPLPLHAASGRAHPLRRADVVCPATHRGAFTGRSARRRAAGKNAHHSAACVTRQRHANWRLATGSLSPSGDPASE